MRLRRFLTFRLSWAIYRSLPRHPLFIRGIQAETRARKQESEFAIVRFLQRFWWLGLPLLAFACVSFGLTVLGFFLSLLAFLVPVIFFIGGATLCGVNAAYGVSRIVAIERESGRYDLLGITPLGLVGVNWVLAARHLRMNRNAIRFHQWTLGMYAIIAFLPILSFISSLSMMVSFSVTNSGVIPFGDYLTFPIGFFLFLALVRLDLTQSVLTGTLIGMLAPTYAQNRLDAGFIASAVFLFVQFSFYVVFIVFVGILGWLGVSTIPILLIASFVFFAMREGILRVLWRIVSQRLNTDLDELDEAAQIHHARLNVIEQVIW